MFSTMNSVVGTMMATQSPLVEDVLAQLLAVLVSHPPLQGWPLPQRPTSPSGSLFPRAVQIQ